MKLSILLLASFTLGTYGAGSSSKGKWQVIDPNSNIPCIVFYGQIDLDLTYIVKETETAKDGHLTVPSTAKVNKASSCNTLLNFKGQSVNTQLMQLDLDPVNLPGWNLRLAFSTDSRFQTRGNEWALYYVSVTANYTADPTHFPNPADSVHTYSSPVELTDTSILADNVFAHIGDSLYCPSKQKYIINDNTTVGPRATMTFSILQVQAYMTTVALGAVTPFGTKETCPTDQHVTDKVPIIVGGVLAGLIVFTMITYLIYRACLPPEVIQLVNPGSHENKAMSIEDEDDEVEQNQHGHH